ncbi:hypothetical protein [Psychroflexus aestuariivivens]|uniref:hypothetical protein n=1 Tax=Psychroflexus aestuariivivens TaxID=1795040 RepID=UPI000FDCBF24|nr:hypothetical protein [Psychroflexus aestuariivivens]
MKRLILPILAFILISCSNDDDSGSINDQPTNLKLEKYEVQWTTYFTESSSVFDLSYNSDGDIISLTETHTDESGEVGINTRYYEYENRKISKIEYNGEYTTLTYEGNQIVETTIYSDEIIKTEFEYDEDGNMVAQIETIDGDYCCTYEYEYDNNGNLLYSQGGFLYKYDNMRNPFSLVFDESYLKINRISNNNTLMVMTPWGDNYSYYSYEYNSEGFPTKREISYETSDRTSVRYYTYK